VGTLSPLSFSFYFQKHLAGLLNEKGWNLPLKGFKLPIVVNLKHTNNLLMMPFSMEKQTKKKLKLLTPH
jgi:hypothetical protein